MPKSDNLRKYSCRIFLVASTVFACWTLLVSTQLFVYTKRTERLANQMTPYEQKGDGSFRILVIGDSLAYGTGASSPEMTLAGLLGSHFPDATVTNKAINGTKTATLAQRVETDIDQRYDLILVAVGSNDIIHPEVNLDSSELNLRKIYKKAAYNSDRVIAITSGDFTDISFFAYPLNIYFGHRSYIVRSHAVNAAASFENVYYIDAFSREYKPPSPRILEASDHLHLSEIGNHYWFERIADTMDQFSN